MKRLNFNKAIPLLATLAGLIFVGVNPGRAQTAAGLTNYVVPVVTVVATDPLASETGDSGEFTIFRSGSTNFPLNVFYRLGGSATYGLDYTAPPAWAYIAAGATSAVVTVQPLADNLAEGDETVVLQLRWSPLLIPVNYSIGTPNSATVTIADGPPAGTNRPPVVSLVAPPNGAVFKTPADILLLATALDFDGTVNKVEFFSGTTSLGVATNNPLILTPVGASPISPFHLVWTNVPPGGYVLTAVATDNGGAMATSAPVNITVVTNLPDTNVPPVVTLFAIDAVASEGTNYLRWAGWPPAPTGTNICCFTNTAAFLVRRRGDTNSDLTVSYAVSGTASNGVDYESLSGVVTIPSGHQTARITVVPIDDDLPEPVETVVLTLQQPTNSPPAYNVGRPARAVAIIVDNDHPRPLMCALSNSLFHVCLPATNTACYRLEFSTNLVNWLPLCTNLVTEGAFHYVDPDATNSPQRFYRVLPDANPPVEN
ncbi:MAG: hypothetical protein HY301_08060 [Verrucomicrobia bacterium]|nr:hypothetical protein [Verrucomicrobiota bacterium]